MAASTIEHRHARRDWGDAALLTALLWSVTVVLYLPVLLARHPAEPVSGALIEGATVLSAMLFGMALFALDRAIEPRPPALRVVLLAAALVTLSAVQVVIDFASTYWVAVWFKPAWSRALPDFARSYTPFFTYVCMYGFNLALFRLVFLRRRAARHRGELAEAQLAAQRAELAALRFQLNPHFLFNSLNAISALIVTRRYGEADEMTGRLSSFLRHALTVDPVALVPLAEELLVAEEYLEIEAVRFGERLDVAIEADAAAAAARVPGFLLQPLIENAIKHGVAPATRPVRLWVEARAEGDRVRVCVANDLPDRAPAKVTGTGVGLANVRARLGTAFGEAATLASGPTGDGRFEVVLTFPTGA